MRVGGAEAGLRRMGERPSWVRSAGRAGRDREAELWMAKRASPRPYGVDGWWKERIVSLMEGRVGWGAPGKRESQPMSDAVRFCEE